MKKVQIIDNCVVKENIDNLIIDAIEDGNDIIAYVEDTNKVRSIFWSSKIVDKTTAEVQGCMVSDDEGLELIVFNPSIKLDLTPFGPLGRREKRTFDHTRSDMRQFDARTLYEVHKQMDSTAVIVASEKLKESESITYYVNAPLPIDALQTYVDIKCLHQVDSVSFMEFYVRTVSSDNLLADGVAIILERELKMIIEIDDFYKKLIPLEYDDEGVVLNGDEVFEKLVEFKIKDDNSILTEILVKENKDSTMVLYDQKDQYVLLLNPEFLEYDIKVLRFPVAYINDQIVVIAGLPQVSVTDDFDPETLGDSDNYDRVPAKKR